MHEGICVLYARFWILINYYSYYDVKEKKRRREMEELLRWNASSTLTMVFKWLKKMLKRSTLPRPSNIFLINSIKYLLPSVFAGSYVLSKTVYMSW